jgi:isopenicillin N synthase-like dioxygenase
MTVPVIDVSPALTDGVHGKRKVAEQIAEANREIGFFIIKGHGVDKQIFTSVMASGKMFFDLPLAEKNQCRATERLMPYQIDGFSGRLEENNHKLMGRENMPGDYVEKFSVGNWILENDRKMPFPSGLAGEQFRQDLKKYYEVCKFISEFIIDLFAIAADLPEGFFADKTTECYDFLRMNYFPKVDPHSTEGLASHKDAAIMALLTETRPGLEVQARNGEWIAVNSGGPDHIVINIGDAMMRWTNDVWLSNSHRVTLSDDYDRQSLAFFKVINEDAMMEVLPKFCQDKPAKYEAVTFGDYIAQKAADLFGEDQVK